MRVSYAQQSCFSHTCSSCGALFVRVCMQGLLPERVVASIAYQALQGIQHLHTSLCMHRDIKPSNMLINARGELKLTDFGIVKELPHKHAKLDAVVGSIKYMSPERLRGQQYGLEAVRDALISLMCLAGRLYQCTRCVTGADTCRCTWCNIDAPTAYAGTVCCASVCTYAVAAVARATASWSHTCITMLSYAGCVELWSGVVRVCIARRLLGNVRAGVTDLLQQVIYTTFDTNACCD